MTIKRYISSKDTTITNAFRPGLTIRATDANTGESDSVEVFSIFGQASASSREKGRILVQFPIDQISSDRSSGELPSSGSVSFILKMSNAVHPLTVPRGFTLLLNPVSGSWEEGYGLDMETYADTGYANWLSSSQTTQWVNEGGDYYENIEVSQFFENGLEDLELDITSIVEQWLDGSIENNGMILRLSSSLEEGNTSYYTKRFFARGSEYFYKRPWIEARFDNTKKDDRGQFYAASPSVPEQLNYNTLYIYNRFRGKLYDLPTVGTGAVYVKLYSSPELPLGTPLTQLGGIDTATGSWESTGIYKASVAIDTDLDTVYDVWFDASGSAVASGGTVKVLDPETQQDFSKTPYDISIKRLKPVYSTKESVRLELFVRPSNWNPNSYTSFTSQEENTVANEIYYKVIRIADSLEVIPYGTGSAQHTKLSYDAKGNYMDLDMSLLEPGYSYGIKFVVHDTGQYLEDKNLFKFRVEE